MNCIYFICIIYVSYHTLQPQFSHGVRFLVAGALLNLRLPWNMSHLNKAWLFYVQVFNVYYPASHYKCRLQSICWFILLCNSLRRWCEPEALKTALTTPVSCLWTPLFQFLIVAWRRLCFNFSIVPWIRLCSISLCSWRHPCSTSLCPWIRPWSTSLYFPNTPLFHLTLSLKTPLLHLTLFPEYASVPLHFVPEDSSAPPYFVPWKRFYTNSLFSLKTPLQYFNLLFINKRIAWLNWGCNVWYVT